MAARKYLDQTGLAHFWSKITTYVDDAQNSPFGVDNDGRLCYTYDTEDSGYEEFDIASGRLTYTYTE